MTAKNFWTDEKAKHQYEALTAKIERVFCVPPEIARAEPHVFQAWFHHRQREAAHLRIEAATIFLTFTKAP